MKEKLLLLLMIQFIQKHMKFITIKKLNLILKRFYPIINLGQRR